MAKLAKFNHEDKIFEIPEPLYNKALELDVVWPGEKRCYVLRNNTKDDYKNYLRFPDKLKDLKNKSYKINGSNNSLYEERRTTHPVKWHRDLRFNEVCKELVFVRCYINVVRIEKIADEKRETASDILNFMFSQYLSEFRRLQARHHFTMKYYNWGYDFVEFLSQYPPGPHKDYYMGAITAFEDMIKDCKAYNIPSDESIHILGANHRIDEGILISKLSLSENEDTEEFEIYEEGEDGEDFNKNKRTKNVISPGMRTFRSQDEDAKKTISSLIEFERDKMFGRDGNPHNLPKIVLGGPNIADMMIETIGDEFAIERKSFLNDSKQDSIIAPPIDVPGYQDRLMQIALEEEEEEFDFYTVEETYLKIKGSLDNYKLTESQRQEALLRFHREYTTKSKEERSDTKFWYPIVKDILAKIREEIPRSEGEKRLRASD